MLLGARVHMRSEALDYVHECENALARRIKAAEDDLSGLGPRPEGKSIKKGPSGLIKLLRVKA